MEKHLNKEIKFGFWNYVDCGQYGREAVLEWKKMGFNLPMTCTYIHEKHKKEDMLEILDECHKQGMKAIVYDIRTDFHTYLQKGKEAYEKGAMDAYQDFGGHPATFGFFIGDEPKGDEWDVAIDAIKIQLRIAPELTPYLNLFPYWPGRDYVELMGGDDREYYREKIEELLEKSNAPLIGYDHYTQCMQEGHNQEGGLDLYFSDLDIYYRATKKFDIPLYVTVLSVGHFWYREPTEDDIRWQMNTALAHGARGVFWFYLYQRGDDQNFRNPPFETDFRKTKTYDYISNQQFIFNTTFKEQFDKMELIDVFHAGRVYEGTKRFYAHGDIMEIKSDKDYPMILSYYKEFDTDKIWISVVNAHQSLSDRFNLYLKNGKTKSYYLAPGQMRLVSLEELLKD